jgi:hypothetical protein
MPTLAGAMHMTSRNAETPKKLTRWTLLPTSLAHLDRRAPHGKQTANAFFIIRSETKTERRLQTGRSPAVARWAQIGSNLGKLT